MEFDVIYVELKELISLHIKEELGELESEEVNIIRSVLDVQMKTATMIMTPMEGIHRNTLIRQRKDSLYSS